MIFGFVLEFGQVVYPGDFFGRSGYSSTWRYMFIGFLCII